MPPSVASFLCALFVIWLFHQDAKRRKGVSAALWIPLAWAFILGSKPVSFWLGAGDELDSAGGYIQDKFIDKATFLFLIAAGLIVLLRRRADWRQIIQRNQWLFVYFLYLGLSVLWSDSPFVAFKRWVKDAGNVVMVLIVLSEKDPIQAVKALLARSAYLLVPLSVLLTKYYQNSSTFYDPWTHQPHFCGVTTNKNILGMTLFVCALGLFWMLLELREGAAKVKDKLAFFIYSGLLVMAGWLFIKAKSATGLSCTIIGCAMLLGMRVSGIRSKVKWLGAYSAAAAVLLLLLQVSGLLSMLIAQFAEFVGRDPTLHGRAEIWEAVLKEDINPLIGVGFYSFWSPERMQRLSETYYYSLNEAHNGYIETYLNNGLIGVLLIIITLGVAGAQIKRDVLRSSHFGALRLTFLITIVLYNITEATFDRLELVWFGLLLVLMEFPRKSYVSVNPQEHHNRLLQNQFSSAAQAAAVSTQEISGLETGFLALSRFEAC